MAVPTHIRMTFRGDFLGTPEHWSFGLHFSRVNDAGADANVNDINVGAVNTACDSFFEAAFARIPSNCKMTDWRAYVIGTDGKAEGDIHVEDVTGLSIAGQSAALYPPQVAICVTKVSDNRGPAHLGRFYLPTNAPLDGSMRVNASGAQALCEEATQFVKALSDAVDLEGLQSSSLLNVSHQPFGGTAQQVDHLEVGRVLDTLRSRRRSMLEERYIGGQIDW